MIELTLERTKELLAEAVAERGEDYVYSTPEGKIPTPDGSVMCYYVHAWDASGPLPEPVAGCIAGYVLHKAGVPLDTLRALERQPADRVLGFLERDDVARAEPRVRMLLRTIQQRQDAGQSWGQAVANTLAEESQAG